MEGSVDRNECCVGGMTDAFLTVVYFLRMKMSHNFYF